MANEETKSIFPDCSATAGYGEAVMILTDLTAEENQKNTDTDALNKIGVGCIFTSNIVFFIISDTCELTIDELKVKLNV